MRDSQLNYKSLKTLFFKKTGLFKIPIEVYEQLNQLRGKTSTRCIPANLFVFEGGGGQVTPIFSSSYFMVRLCTEFQPIILHTGALKVCVVGGG